MTGDTPRKGRLLPLFLALSAVLLILVPVLLLLPIWACPLCEDVGLSAASLKPGVCEVCEGTTNARPTTLLKRWVKLHRIEAYQEFPLFRRAPSRQPL